jgi:hypothetical protein
VTAPFTQDDFLAVAARFLPDGYLLPLQIAGPGYELLQAHAAACARVSQAVCGLEAQTFARTASTASLATAQVLFSRPTALAGALTIKAGTVVVASATGRKFVLLSDLAVGALALSAGPVSVSAITPSAEFNNCRGPRTAADGSTIPGDIDEVFSLVTSPDYADPTITVSQVADASGGAADHLGQLGADLDQLRGTSEDLNAYRARLAQLPDSVSPAAVRRLLAVSFMAAYGTAYSAAMLEPWSTSFQTAWDVPTSGAMADPILNAVCCYDDPRVPGGPNVPASGFWGAWLCEDDLRGSVIVVVPLVAASTDAIGGDGNPIYDGLNPARNAFYAGLWAALKNALAGGVTLRVVHPWP